MCLEPECSERPWPGDAVGQEMEAQLEATKAGHRRPVHERVDRHMDSLLVQQELQYGDVPAEAAARKRARAEQRRAERAELATGGDVGDAGRAQAVRPLEPTHRGDRAGADDAVDRPQVEALRPQSDLEARMLRV